MARKTRGGNGKTICEKLVVPVRVGQELKIFLTVPCQPSQEQRLYIIQHVITGDLR